MLNKLQGESDDSSHPVGDRGAEAFFNLIISAFRNYGAGISGSQLWSIFSCCYCLIQCKRYGERTGKHISHQFMREVSKSFA